MFNGILVKTMKLMIERREFLFKENVELKMKLEQALAAQKEQGVKSTVDEPLSNDPYDRPSQHTRSCTRLGARTRKGVFKK